MPLKKNQLITLSITAPASDGNGVGRYVNEEYPQGMVIFVPYTAPGDIILCRVTKVEKRCAFGRIEQLLQPSEDRCARTDCTVFGKCGGCAWRHVFYEAEMRYKEGMVNDCLTRLGGLDIPIDPIVGANQPNGYRNKAQFPVAEGENAPLIGFYAPRSHRIVQQTACALQPPVFSDILERVSAWMTAAHVSAYHEETGRGLVRHVYIRQGAVTGEIMVCLVCTSDRLPAAQQLVESLREVPGMTSVLVNLNAAKTNVILGETTQTLWGSPTITDVLCGLRFRLSPLSFYQVNHAQAERLYGLAAKLADLHGTETLLDLYCGTGTIGLSMANQAALVIGVEIVQPAVEDARRNAQENGITNARFLCADASKAAAKLQEEGIRPDVVIVDPPRKGCDESVLHTIAQMAPQRLVYISCNPATLARDMARLQQDGYLAKHVTPVDMFPRTTHVETVCLMSRKDK